MNIRVINRMLALVFLVLCNLAGLAAILKNIPDEWKALIVLFQTGISGIIMAILSLSEE